jgi:hypothetical protein
MPHCPAAGKKREEKYRLRRISRIDPRCPPGAAANGYRADAPFPAERKIRAGARGCPIVIPRRRIDGNRVSEMNRTGPVHETPKSAAIL